MTLEKLRKAIGKKELNRRTANGFTHAIVYNSGKPYAFYHTEKAATAQHAKIATRMHVVDLNG